MRRAALLLAIASCSRPVSAPTREAVIDPPAPDYADPSSWAARPEVDDGSDLLPPAEVGRRGSVDVFFVHPTTHYERAPNAAFDAPGPGRFVDTLVLPNQAAAFNGAGPVFAPRYRQATLWTFTTRRDFDAAARAMDLAYGDVERAFDAWARESDRPVVIAAHSQGSYHALRLLASRFEGEMRSRLVAAYLIGIPIPEDVLTRTIPSVPLCERADDTGCVLTWNTVLEGARPARLRRRLPIYYPGASAWETTAGDRLLCVNPLDGSREGWAPREAHLGAVFFADGLGHPIEPRVEPAITRARCVDGVLEVERSVPLRFRNDPLSARGDLHLADYPLFFMNVRRDVERRANAFIASTRP